MNIVLAEHANHGEPRRCPDIKQEATHLRRYPLRAGSDIRFAREWAITALVEHGVPSVLCRNSADSKSTENR
jgi:hypothetical protein